MTVDSLRLPALPVPPRAMPFIKIGVVLLIALTSNLWAFEFSGGLTSHYGKPSILVGLGMLAVLMSVFGGLFWWLYLSPLKATTRVQPIDYSPAARRRRGLVGGLMVVSSVTWIIGGIWDTLWHVWLGGFGNDFLWPPHIVIYGSFLVNAVVGGGVLLSILLGKGNPKVRARREPALGIAALASAYLIFSLPSDLVWHQIYGLDINGFSLPHMLIVIMSMIASIAATSLLLTSIEPGKITFKIRLGVIVFMSSVLSTWLLTVQPEYDWGQLATDTSFLIRPGWVYGMLVYLPGLFTGMLVLFLLKRAGSATLVTIFVLLGRLGMQVAGSTLPLDVSMNIISHFVLIIPAIAIDMAYARTSSALPPRQRALRIGLVYWIVCWPTALLAIHFANVGVVTSPLDVIVGMGLGLIVLVLFGLDVPRLARILSGEEQLGVTQPRVDQNSVGEASIGATSQKFA